MQILSIILVCATLVLPNVLAEEQEATSKHSVLIPQPPITTSNSSDSPGGSIFTTLGPPTLPLPFSSVTVVSPASGSSTAPVAPPSTTPTTPPGSSTSIPGPTNSPSAQSSMSLLGSSTTTNPPSAQSSMGNATTPAPSASTTSGGETKTVAIEKWLLILFVTLGLVSVL